MKLWDLSHLPTCKKNSITNKKKTSKNIGQWPMPIQYQNVMAYPVQGILFPYASSILLADIDYKNFIQ